MKPPRWDRVFPWVVWIIAAASAFYAASHQLSGKQHLVGALASIALVLVIGLALYLLDKRRGSRSGPSGRDSP